MVCDHHGSCCEEEEETAEKEEERYYQFPVLSMQQIVVVPVFLPGKDVARSND